jgi:hypothetical protein
MASVTVPATTKLEVKWADRSTNEAAFQLQRCGPSATASCTAFASLARVNSTSAATTGTVYPYTNSALTAGRYYCYRVQACNRASACSTASAAVCALAK